MAGQKAAWQLDTKDGAHQLDGDLQDETVPDEAMHAQ